MPLRRLASRHNSCYSCFLLPQDLFARAASLSQDDQWPRTRIQALGVSRTATDDEIRRAYRNLAKELHPDLNPGNQRRQERFKKVAAANDIIGDPDKRKQYDRGEIDASGEPRRPQYRSHAGGPRPVPAAAAPAGLTGSAFPTFSATSFGDAPFNQRGPRGSRFPAAARMCAIPSRSISWKPLAGAKKRVTLPDGWRARLGRAGRRERRAGLATSGKGRSFPRRGTRAMRSSKSRCVRMPQFKRQGTISCWTCRSPSMKPFWAPKSRSDDNRPRRTHHTQGHELRDAFSA